MTKFVTEDVIYTRPVTFQILPTQLVGSLQNLATPSVKNSLVWKGCGSVVTVTDLLYGATGQTIRILGDGTTTISNNAHIKTNTGANKLLASSKVYVFTLIDNIWYEDA